MITFVPGSLPVRPAHPKWCKHDAVASDLSLVTHFGQHEVDLGEAGEAAVRLVRQDDEGEQGVTGIQLQIEDVVPDGLFTPRAALLLGVALIRASQDALAIALP